jgi:Flp pilus assembly pilin Flp
VDFSVHTGLSGDAMFGIFKQLHEEDAAQALIEFALICLIVGLGTLAGMGKLASSINQEFTKVAGSLT